MKAIHVTSLDGPRAVELVDIEEPPTSGKECLIDIHATGISFPEALLTRGLYQLKPDLPFIPGSEVAGVIRTAPEGSSFSPGQRVAAFPGFGGLAESVAVHPLMVFPLPDSASFETGAGLLLNYFTMHFAYVTRGNLQAGETVLIHGAAGGIGTAAIQLAKFLGARVIAVVSNAEREKIALQAGADQVVFADGFREVLSGTRIDMVVDPVGGDRFTDSLRVLAPGGRLLVIGFTAGSIPEVKVNRLLLNNISVMGVGWGAYWMGRHMDFLQEQWKALLPGITDGSLAPIVTAQYPLADAADAIAAIEERRALGKIMVKIR